jgi:HK97 family phage major capsid protein
MKLLDQLVDERAEIGTAMAAVCDAAAEETRDLSETEEQNLSDLHARADSLDARISELRDIQLANAEAAKMRAEVTPTQDDAEKATEVRVSSEPLTYGENAGVSFFRDVFASQYRHDPAAQARIARHTAEMAVEYRDVGSGAFAGLVVPQYLTNLAADLARAGRPTANVCNRLPLPSDGMTINVSRVTTGSSTAIQATENSAVSETDLDDTLLTVNVRTVAGQQDVSRQALERGTGIDALIMGDLAASYAATLDTQVINGSGSSGQHLGILNTTGINAVTYTAATATIAGLWPKIIKAIGDVNENRFLPADVVIMHPRRLAWVQAQVDGNSRPIFVPTANMPQNAMGIGEVAGYGAIVGQIAGVDVATDANIPTNLGSGSDEDRIIVARRADLVLWEQGDGAPALLRMDQTIGGSLTVKVVTYGYSAFTAGRYPVGVSVISGTGLNDTL